MNHEENFYISLGSEVMDVSTVILALDHADFICPVVNNRRRSSAADTRSLLCRSIRAAV